MDFHERRERALQLLAQTGIGRSTYAPPLMRLLWRCGLKLRPPHFMGFGVLAVLWGAQFAFLWGAFMWLALWSRQHGDLRAQTGAVCVAGLCFGLPMAVIYAHQRMRHDLPSWDSLGAQ